MPKTCPDCRLIHPDTATLCDCGYDFSTGRGRSDRVPVPPAAPRPTGDRLPGEPTRDHLVARGLVWVLRGLAALAAVWGLIQVSNAAEASRVVGEAVKKQLPVDPGHQERVVKAAEEAGEAAMFTAVVVAAALVTVLLVLAEGLRLCILIEGNTRAVLVAGGVRGGRAEPGAAPDPAG